MENNNNIIGNIDLSLLRKKRYTINGDENLVLELDTSDFSIINRLSDVYPKLFELASEISDIPDDVTSEDAKNTLSDIDNRMRAQLDDIFDSNVSEICAPKGSMYDLFGGEFRFEIIITALIKLYGDNIEQEAKRLQKRIKSHTDKYTKK